MPRHHLLPRFDGRIQKVEQALGKAQGLCLEGVQVDGVWGNVYLKRLAGGDFLYLFGTPNAQFLGQLYRKRWTIEACFQALKGRGFDLESTHLKDLKNWWLWSVSLLPRV